MANRLYKSLDPTMWKITVIDKDPLHHYQPGFLFIPFGIYQPKDLIKQEAEFLPKKVGFIVAEAERINAGENSIVLKNGAKYNYDILIIATGAEIVPEETPGLKEKLWYKDIFDFCTFEGAKQLAEKLKTWKGGNW